jgi:hypothetical protein
MKALRFIKRGLIHVSPDLSIRVLARLFHTRLSTKHSLDSISVTEDSSAQVDVQGRCWMQQTEVDQQWHSDGVSW